MRTLLPFRSTSVIASLLERDIVYRGTEVELTIESGLPGKSRMADVELVKKKICNSESWWGLMRYLAG